MKGVKGWGLGSGIVLAMALGPCGSVLASTEAGMEAAAPKDARVGPEAMAGLSFEGLTEERKALAASILNENGCDCGCGMKLAVCRRDDSTCGRSLEQGKQVVALAKEGKGRDEIVKTVLSPPSKYVEFALDAGGAPVIGPAGAKVTILHYLDYQ